MLSLSAEAAIEPDDAPVAIVFGPENGAVAEKLVYEAAREAHAKSYEQLLVIGFRCRGRDDECDRPLAILGILCPDDRRLCDADCQRWDRGRPGRNDSIF